MYRRTIQASLRSWRLQILRCIATCIDNTKDEYAAIAYTITGNPNYIFNRIAKRESERRKRGFVFSDPSSSEAFDYAGAGFETGRTLAGRTSTSSRRTNRRTIRIHSSAENPRSNIRTKETREVGHGVDGNSSTENEASRNHPRRNGPR